MHDQVRADRPGLVLAQTALDLVKPGVELFGAPAVNGRKRADHAAPAGGDDELDAGNQKHRRRNQRQTETVAKSRQGIGSLQRALSLLSVASEIGTTGAKD